MCGFSLKRISALGPATTESRASEKSLFKISITGNVRITSPRFDKVMSRILWIFDLSDFVNDIIHRYLFHTHIIRAVEIITRFPVTTHVFLDHGKSPPASGAGDLGPRWAKEPDDRCSNAGRQMKRTAVGGN